MESSKTIQCVGFIMDGNRRWAKMRNLLPFEGHKAGYDTLKRIIKSVGEYGIPHMVCYAFSTENWKRTEEEVSYLMSLMHSALAETLSNLGDETLNVRVRVVGERSKLPENLQKEISRVEEESAHNRDLTVWVALSYGGRVEIVDAVNRAVAEGKEVTEASFEKLLWTGDMPDPDIIIRTSGEQRTSNFLLWKASYSELFFTDTLWPDFGKDELESILDEYERRERRIGA